MIEVNEFNLVEEPWIPVVDTNGENRMVSIMDVFCDKDQKIADLSLNPYERVAVFRLLLCIAQAALGEGNPADESAWLATRDRLGETVAKYLVQWKRRFYLYGQQAFMQPDSMAPKLDKKGKEQYAPRDKLFFKLASGNNATLYDHEALSSEERELTDGNVAIGLLAFLSFSAGGRSSSCRWNGKVTKEDSITAAPCRERSMLFTILQGKYLLETIWMNLLTKELVESLPGGKFGCPFWEFDTLDRKPVKGNELTYLGHLVPFSRTIKPGKGAECLIGEALAYPQLPIWRDPMATVIQKPGKKKGDPPEDAYISTNPERLPWRDLGSILSLNDKNGKRSALALKHLDYLKSDEVFSIWTGGLLCDKSKEVDTVEWKASLTVDFLNEDSLKKYEGAMEDAIKQIASLKRAIAEYATCVNTAEKATFSTPAERHYWDTLGKPENQSIVLNVGASEYQQIWRDLIYKVALEAYAVACPRLNSRQLEAYAQGLSQLKKVKE